MVRLTLSRHVQSRFAHNERKRRAFVATVASIVILSAATAVDLSWNRLNPEPYHTSRLSGREWVEELVMGHRDRMRDALGLRPALFHKLEKELIEKGNLTGSRWVDTSEQLAIFLYQIVTNNSVRKTAERFQRSNETVSKAFKAVLYALISPHFRHSYIKLPDPTIVHDRIQKDPKLQFFKDAIGAIDGTHLSVKPPANTRGRWRDRKGNLSQNVLAACDFNMSFVFILAGWEGSAADSFLYQSALTTGGLAVPPGKYYLADAGFASCETLLVPYRNVRYHLREWMAGSDRPQTKEELFNLRHAQLRNVIERIFGILKREFKMAAEANEYPIRIQCLIPLALCILHNFLRVFDPSRHASELLPATREQPVGDPHGDLEPRTNMVRETESTRANARRDAIATAMWEQYQAELQARRTASTQSV